MIKITAVISKFGSKGEKTGWSYILIPSKLAQQLKPGFRKSFRIRGRLDEHIFSGLALIPMGDGSYILPLNTGIRKIIRKQKGDRVSVEMEEDPDFKITTSPDLLDCLNDEPVAKENFYLLPASHRNYYVKWIEQAKTVQTKTKRIARSVTALSRGLNYGEMIRFFKKDPGTPDDILL